MRTVISIGSGVSYGSYYFPDSGLDASYQAIVPLDYPAWTQPGPATVHFYAIGPGIIGNWEGDTAFTADPTTCTDVDLLVPFIEIGVDAGVGDAG